MDDLRLLYEQLPTDSSPEERQSTAQALERRNYSPILILEVPNFLYLTREGMLSEFERVIGLPDSSMELQSAIGIKDALHVKEKHLFLLLNQYRLLCSLRRNEGDAWQTINELYEDD